MNPLCLIDVHIMKKSSADFLQPLLDKYGAFFEEVDVRRCRFCSFIQVKGDLVIPKAE